MRKFMKVFFMVASLYCLGEAVAFGSVPLEVKVSTNETRISNVERAVSENWELTGKIFTDQNKKIGEMEEVVKATRELENENSVNIETVSGRVDKVSEVSVSALNKANDVDTRVVKVESKIGKIDDVEKMSNTALGKAFDNDRKIGEATTIIGETMAVSEVNKNNISKHEDRIGELEYQDKKDKETIRAAIVEAHEERKVIDEKVNENTSDIEKAEEERENIKSDVKNIEDQLYEEGNRNKRSGKVLKSEANKERILYVNEKIENVGEAVEENKEKIEKNTKKIDTNTTNIQRNSDRIEKFESKLASLESEMNRGFAMSAAANSIVYPELGEGDLGIGAGVGGYNDSQAVAVGVAVQPTKSFRVNANVSTSDGSDVMYGAGMGYKFNLFN